MKDKDFELFLKWYFFGIFAFIPLSVTLIVGGSFAAAFLFTYLCGGGEEVFLIALSLFFIWFTAIRSCFKK